MCTILTGCDLGSWWRRSKAVRGACFGKMLASDSSCSFFEFYNALPCFTDVAPSCDDTSCMYSNVFYCFLMQMSGQLTMWNIFSTFCRNVCYYCIFFVSSGVVTLTKFVGYRLFLLLLPFVTCKSFNIQRTTATPVPGCDGVQQWWHV